ncbi:MAG: hypothetical protein ABII23_02865, partial [bacterium]
SKRQIAASCNVGRRTVSQYCTLADESGLTWSEAKDLNDEALRIRLYGDRRGTLLTFFTFLQNIKIKLYKFIM